MSSLVPSGAPKRTCLVPFLGWVKASYNVHFGGTFGVPLSTSVVQARCRWMNPTHVQNPIHYVCTQIESPIHHIRHNVDIIIV